jgi:amino acid transporter
MANRELIKTEIRKEAEVFIAGGTSKQETFRRLAEKYHNPKLVADAVKFIPTPEAIRMYRKWNWVILAIIVIAAGAALVAKPNVGVALWLVALAYIVYKMLIEYYIWVTALAGFGLISILAIMANEESLASQWTEVIFILLPLIPLIIMPLWLKNKMCPPPNEQKEACTDSHGHRKYRIVYTFPEEK